MEIREGTEKDIPEILNVLKASLGEISSQKTADVWRFKHLDNPFGKSLVLLAVDEGQIIGVRAFMRWKWQSGNESFSAFRAVDTATHPEHRGKGVFKKLTLKALEIGEANEEHFVFNTPNKMSKPGYLKMGWEEVDKLRTTVRPINPIFWKSSKRERFYPKTWNDNKPFHFLESHNEKLVFQNKLFTPKDTNFLKWRYLNNPLQDYRVLATPNLFLAGYVKDRSGFKELRMSEVIRSPKISEDVVKKEIRSWARSYGVHFLSYSPGSELRFFTGITGKFGPVLTFRNMNVPKNREAWFLKIKSWNYSLGDLELF